MKVAFVRPVVQKIRKIAKARDRFWSGVWWTEWRLYRNERRLAHALEAFGEDSMQVRALTEQHRRLENGIKYWRPSDATVVSVFEACEREGVSRSDLRLLALNRDVFVARGHVQVRQGWLRVSLAWLTCSVVIASWLLLAALFVFSPVALSIRVSGVLVVWFLYWLTWPGFGLYATKAVGAVARSGRAIELIAEQYRVRKATLVSFDISRQKRLGHGQSASPEGEDP